LALQRRTKISQKSPEQTDDALNNFYTYVNNLWTKKSFELQNILNMDETPVWFDMAGNVTINEKGKKTVHIHGTGNEKNRFTVILTYAADETKFPPICIFKGQCLSRKEQIPSGERNHEHKTSAMMVYDSFSGHLEDSVKKKFRENGYNLAVIPGGLTSICQPLDIAINKPFKDHLRKEWYIWMSKGGAGKTTKGNLRHARISDVCRWIKNSWKNISTEIIIRSFEYCGLLGNSDHNKENEELEVIDLSN
ncbi:5815_t:CDS:2, partial [Scutellospora calospora]